MSDHNLSIPYIVIICKRDFKHFLFHDAISIEGAKALSLCYRYLIPIFNHF